MAEHTSDPPKKRGVGRPKGTPASAAQRATGKENHKKAIAAKRKRAAARRAAEEKPRWKKLEDGDISIRDLTDEELVRGEVANNDGTWEGRRHAFNPRMLSRFDTEYKRRIKKGLDKLGMLALDAIEDRLYDDEAPAQQLGAAKMVIEYNIGKVPEVVHVGAETEYDRLQQSAFVIRRDLLGKEPAEVEASVSEDIVDAELVEE